MDEALIAFKGRTRLRQYLPAKPKKLGILLRVVCNSINNYINDFKMYKAGAEMEIGSRLFDISKELLNDAVAKATKTKVNFTLYCDNLYTSIELAEYLNSGGNDIVGTLRLKRISRFTKFYKQYKNYKVGKISLKNRVYHHL